MSAAGEVGLTTLTVVSLVSAGRVPHREIVPTDELRTLVMVVSASAQLAVPARNHGGL